MDCQYDILHPSTWNLNYPKLKSNNRIRIRILYRDLSLSSVFKLLPMMVFDVFLKEIMMLGKFWSQIRNSHQILHKIQLYCWSLPLLHGCQTYHKSKFKRVVLVPKSEKSLNYLSIVNLKSIWQGQFWHEKAEYAVRNWIWSFWTHLFAKFCQIFKKISGYAVFQTTLHPLKIVQFESFQDVNVPQPLPLPLTFCTPPQPCYI